MVKTPHNPAWIIHHHQAGPPGPVGARWPVPPKGGTGGFFAGGALVLNSKDLSLLKQIQSFFGLPSFPPLGGQKITNKKDGSSMYYVGSKKDLTNVIVPRGATLPTFSAASRKTHFLVLVLKYPLISKKGADFILFNDILALMNKGEHLTNEGLQKIQCIRASINRGLSKRLLESFLDIIPVERPIIKPVDRLDPNWLSGFISGEGCCFFVNIATSETTKTRFNVILELSISQHSRDTLLIQSLGGASSLKLWTQRGVLRFEDVRVILGHHTKLKYWECGVFRAENRNPVVYLKLSRISDILNVIIPFFTKYPILGSKRLDFDDTSILRRKVVKLVERKEHLTNEGPPVFSEKIRQIKSRMNTGRDYLKSGNIETPRLERVTICTKSVPKIQKRDFHTHAKAINRIGPHEADLVSVIIGSLIGNCIVSRSVEGTRLCYRQSLIHKDYLFWLYDFFYSRGYCSNLEPRKYTRRLKKGEQIQEHYGYEFNTFTFRSFNWIHKMFYKNGKKVLVWI